MKLVVCLKRVFDTAAQLKIAAGGKAFDAAGVECVMNPYDEYALESALRLKDATKGELTVISLGPAEATKEIRTALAMGADRAIHLKSADTGRDSYSTATILAAAVKQIPFDVVFFGARAVDTDNFQVGPMVSELVGFCLISEVVELALDGGKLLVTREEDGGHAKIRIAPPCGVTFQKGVHEPRYATLPNIMKAKKKPLEERAVEAAAKPAIEILALEPPQPRPPGRIVGEGVGAVPELVRALRNEVKVL